MVNVSPGVIVCMVGSGGLITGLVGCSSSTVGIGGAVIVWISGNSVWACTLLDDIDTIASAAIVIIVNLRIM